MILFCSLNPAIDVGQVEGAFAQGVGWCVFEELVWGDKEHKWVRPAVRVLHFASLFTFY